MKSCSMGRSSRDRKKRTRVSEEEEQKKIRDSILKVFQARLSTPGKGGALLVAEPRPTEKSKHKKQKKHRAVSTSTSTDDSSFQSMSGRGRKRTKSLTRRKSRKITKQKKEVEKDTAVAKHLRGCPWTSAGIKNDIRNKPKMYSHSRITQKVGLIRTGTKSELASRGIVVPEHISKQTDEEIRKMSEEAEAELHMAGDIEVAEKLVLSRVRAGSSEKKSLTPASIDMRPQFSVPSSAESVKDRQNQSGVGSGKFPETLPVGETVASLLVTLKYHTRTLYPGRDYLKETHDELLKLLKQNAPRSATPTRLPVFSTITKSGSVRRPLVESFDIKDSHSTDNKRNAADVMDVGNKNDTEHAYSFNKHISMVPKINFADKNPFQATNNNGGKSHSDVRNVYHTGLSSIKRIRDQHYSYKQLDVNGNANGKEGKENDYEEESLHHLYNNSRLLDHRRKKVQAEIRSYIDTHKNSHSGDIKSGNLAIKNQFSGIDYFFARSKLEEDDYFFPGSSTSCGQKMPKSPVLKSRVKLVMPRSPVLSWEATSLLQVNEENDYDRDMFEPMEIDTKSAEAVNLLQQNDILKDRSKQHLLIERQVSGLDRTLDWVKREGRSNSQCSHCSQDSGEFNSHVQVEAMDILDYADQIGRDSYMDCRGDQTASLNTSTSDCSGSLGWRARDTVPHRKTALPASPKSPDAPKFYPKKMF
ncbi:uncharacterized protein LOC132736103 [Ruditapes philippinarum]|uniref:uncharacterized protein LOC132736103 n=1 Tax=Ruditapes philippinarum TaxID=129788 RepID=UPI00295B2E53|nr:uncharacterized protein LOC132736103 [Ruditapes philippinarum]